MIGTIPYACFFLCKGLLIVLPIIDFEKRDLKKTKNENFQFGCNKFYSSLFLI